jgi:hypothetical protein
MRAIIAWQETKKSKKVSAAVLNQANAHYQYLARAVNKFELEHNLEKLKHELVVASRAALSAQALVKAANNTDDKNLTSNEKVRQERVRELKSEIQNATEDLEDMQLAVKAARSKYAMAEAAEKAGRVAAEKTLADYVHQHRGARALEMIVTQEETALDVQHDAEADAEKEAEARRAAASGATGVDGGVEATGNAAPSLDVESITGAAASGMTGNSATAIEARQVMAKAQAKKKMLEAVANESIAEETIDGNNKSATGNSAEAEHRISMELKKQRLIKAAKAAKLAQEAIDGPRADNDKSDEELAAEKEAEKKAAKLIEDTEKSITGGAATGSSVAENVARKNKTTKKPATKVAATGAAGTVRSGTGSFASGSASMSGSTGSTGSTGGVADAAARLFNQGQLNVGVASTGATGSAATGVDQAPPPASPRQVVYAINMVRRAEAELSQLYGEKTTVEAKLAKVERSYATVMLKARQDPGFSRALLLNAENQVNAVKTEHENVVKKLSLAKANVEAAKEKVREVRAVLKASGMDAVMKGLPVEETKEPVVELPKIVAINPRDVPETRTLKNALVKALLAVPKEKLRLSRTNEKLVKAQSECKYAQTEADAAKADYNEKVKMYGASPQAKDAAEVSGAGDRMNETATTAIRRCELAASLNSDSNKTTIAVEKAEEKAVAARKALDAFLSAKRLSFVNGVGPMPRRFMKPSDFEAEKVGIERAVEGSVDPKDLLPIGATPLPILEKLGIDSHMVDSSEKAIWYMKGEYTFAQAANKCNAPIAGVHMPAHVCSEEEVRNSMAGGFDVCACGFTSTVPAKDGKAKYGSASGFNVFIASIKGEGCGVANEGGYCNFQKRSGVYCCADVKDGKLKTLELNGKVPVLNVDGTVTLGDGSAAVVGSEEVQTTGLKELIRQGDLKTKAIPEPIKPVVVKKSDNKTAIDTIRALVKRSKEKLLASMKKNVTQQVPVELGATGGSVPKPIHASGATGLGKSPNEGGITGAQEEVKAAPAETGSKGEQEEQAIGKASTGGVSREEALNMRD